MQSVLNILEARITDAMAKAAGGVRGAAMVRPATDPRFGDYQVNGVMPLAKRLQDYQVKGVIPLAKKVQIDPRTIAELIIRTLRIDDICEKPEIAGPGFINLRLKPEFVAKNLLEINKDVERLGVEETGKPKTIVVDFSGPNIAKQMHVGHLRSTIIGDCICRLLEFEGHKVIPQNHIGDWGTQFGMLCAEYERRVEEETKKGKGAVGHKVLADVLAGSEELYREVQQRFNSNEKFAEEARAMVLRLHTGDPIALAYWENIVRYSKRHYEEVYVRLGVTLEDKDIRGESFYRDMLTDVVEELKKKKLAEESEGAVCVFPEGFKDKDRKALPVIVQKSDGAYLYATTDLAAIRYRVTGIEYEGKEYKADEIIYVTDARQQLHFEMVFAVAEMAKWAKRDMLHHVTFGSVLGENGKPLKTREGENVKLKDLLDEAVKRARVIVEEKNPELSADKKEQIAKAVGIGAVKYADYSNNRESDYVFSFDKMLAMEGNTAPYMQYAYARVRSIKRKAIQNDPEAAKILDKEVANIDVEDILLADPAEFELAKHLIRYSEAIEAAATDYRPNYLTSYLYELAQKFSVFYTNCPVLGADPNIQPTRLLLCDLTAKTIKHGLSNLLGIEVVEQM